MRHATCRNLSEQPHDLASRIPMHRQHVDDVGPVVSSPVAVAEQLRGDRVTVGLVVDQNAAEGVASLRVESLEQSLEFAVTLDPVRQTQPPV